MDKPIETPTIRPFEEKDIDAVSKIMLNAFKSKFRSLKIISDEKMVQLFKESGFVEDQPFKGYLVAEMDEEVVGVMSLKWQDQVGRKGPKKNNFFRLCRHYGLFNILKLFLLLAILEGRTSEGECYIEHIAVSSSYRGQNIGTMLLNHVDRIVEDTAVLNRITLYVSEGNASAIKLYERLGFVLRRRESSRISQFLLREKTWYYMVKVIKDKDNQNQYSMKSGWWLGFLGIIGFSHIPSALLFIEGGESPVVLLGLLWFLWLPLLIPQKK
jgi:ribosomal protein S18 acetylase RimI-like enzyme